MSPLVLLYKEATVKALRKLLLNCNEIGVRLYELKAHAHIYTHTRTQSCKAMFILYSVLLLCAMTVEIATLFEFI